MEKEKKGFGFIFDKSLKTLKNNLFVLIPNLIFYIITGAITMAIIMPIMKMSTSNPYALMNKFESNPEMFFGAYLLFLVVIVAVSLFIESGNMYMIRNVVKGESKGLSDFMSGLTKYPHKLLGFGFVMTLIGTVVYIMLVLVVIMAVKIGTFFAVIIGITLFILAVFLIVVFQPYDAVMAMGDNGAMDTIPKTFKFGKSNFLSLFLLLFIVLVISLLFQGAASVTSGASSFASTASGNPEFNMIPFIIVYIIQTFIGLVLNGFSRTFRFTLHLENSIEISESGDGAILNDYQTPTFDSNTEETSKIDITKSNDSNEDK